jgi:putative transposase
MRYRRADVKGGTYFFTVHLAERKRILLVDHIDVLRTVMKKVKAVHAFRIDARVILPDHLHAMSTLPESDAKFITDETKP